MAKQTGSKNPEILEYMSKSVYPLERAIAIIAGITYRAVCSDTKESDFVEKSV